MTKKKINSKLKAIHEFDTANAAAVAIYDNARAAACDATRAENIARAEYTKVLFHYSAALVALDHALNALDVIRK